MADRTTAAEPSGGGPEAGLPDDRTELQRELDRRGEEILRLRDLLIAKDAELGAALGRLAELEDLSRRLIGVAARVQARVPGAMRLAGAGLRRLEARRGRTGG